MVIVGDGLAGLMLASRLNGVEVWGENRSNTPPRALVHLFAGRTFRRDPVEIQAFRRAVEYWRAEPLAQEYPVERSITLGDRLDRSLEASSVPSEFQPRRVDSGRVRYGPGFSIAAQALRDRWLARVPYRRARYQDDGRPRVLATGTEIAQTLGQVEWDRSEGECWTCPGESPASIVIGRGLHIAPGDREVVIGGRPDLDTAAELSGTLYQKGEVWSGQRCANAKDRRPVLGWLDERTFLFCSFGSRGLFWLPYCADLAVEALQSGSEEGIPPELSWRRLPTQPAQNLTD